MRYRSFQTESDSAVELLTYLTQGKLSNIRAILDKCLSLGIRVTRSQLGILWLYDGQLLRQTSCIDSVNNESSQQSPFVSMPVYGQIGPSIGLTGTCFAQQQPIISDDLVHDSRSIITPHQAFQQNLRACAAVPISLEKFAVGVITVLRSAPRAYEPDVVSKLCLLATKIALCLHHCIYFPGLTGEWLKVLDDSQSKCEPTLQTRGESSNVRLTSNLALEKPVHSLDDNDRKIISTGCARNDPKFPKGIQPATLKIVWKCFEDLQKPLTCNQVAEITGFSTVTARRYLNYMVNVDMVNRKLQYGDLGRPGFVYFI